MLDKITVTEENIDELHVPSDQREELEVGCVTWWFDYGYEGGCFTVWPNGRFAVCYGGGSSWGDVQKDGTYMIDDVWVVLDEYGRRATEDADA